MELNSIKFQHIYFENVLNVSVENNVCPNEDFSFCGLFRFFHTKETSDKNPV